MEVYTANKGFDIEHEVFPVTSGHRVTITYQLYITGHIGGVAHQRFPAAGPTLYPLYHGLRDILELPGFIKIGKSIFSLA